MSLSRREFLNKTAMATSSVLMSRSLLKTALGNQAKGGNFIGMEGPTTGSSADYASPDGGIPHTLDLIKQNVPGLNYMFPFFYAFNRFYLNAWPPNPEYYRDTTLKMDYDTDGLGPRDYVDFFCEEARKRDIHVGATIFPCGGSGHSVRRLKNWQSVLEVDIYGSYTQSLSVCFNNPDFQAHYFGMLRDLFENYPVVAAMYGSEEGGPLYRFLKQGRRPTCFCPYCLDYAKAHGVNPLRARKGFEALHDVYGRAPRGAPAGENVQLLPDYSKRSRPVDGFFVEFLRIITRYPEVLFWNHMWHQHQINLQKETYRIIKGIDASRLVGYHLWHRGTFDPLMRAEEDYRHLLGYADFFRPTVFSHPAGSRHLENVLTLAQTLFGDLELEDVNRILFKILGVPYQGSVEQIKNQRFNADYVKSELNRAVQNADGRAKVYAGVAAHHYLTWTLQETTPEQVIEDIEAAAETDVNGILFGSAHPGLFAAMGEGLQRANWI